MKALETAIYNRYQASPELLAALSGGLYLIEAPQGTQAPYGVFSMPSDVDEPTFEEKVLELSVRFNVYAKSASEVESVMDLLRGNVAGDTGFDYAELSVDEYDADPMLPQNRQKRKSGDLWMRSILYTITLEYTGNVARVHNCAPGMHSLMGF